MSRILIIAGVLLIFAGALWPWLAKFGLTRMPGDIFIQKKNFTLYFPLATSLLISAVLSLILWFFSKRP
jgi:hypothetical protein